MLPENLNRMSLWFHAQEGNDKFENSVDHSTQSIRVRTTLMSAYGNQQIYTLKYKVQTLGTKT